MPFFLVRNVMVFNMASSVATVSQMQQGKQKRPRKTNWSDSEITVLTEKVEENLDLIRSKFSNNVTNAKKNTAWLEITEAVNAVGVAYRTAQEVRDKWKNLTSTAKKELSDFGKEQRKTGGGPAPKKPSNATAKVIEIFKETPSFTGLSGFETNPGKLKFKNLQFVLCSLRAKSRRQASEFKFLVLNWCKIFHCYWIQY